MNEIKTDKYHLMQCDCLEYMATVPYKQFELAIIDPDFGLNDKISQGGTWASKYKKGDGDLGGKPTKQYFDELFRISKNQIIWGGNYFIDMLFPTRCYLIWDKVAQMETLADCEMAWTSFDLNAKIFKHVRNTSETRIHICQKPIKLYEWIFNRFAKPNDKIFDSHLGSMSIVISALKYNLHITGTEISENYFNAGIKRVREYESQYKIF